MSIWSWYGFKDGRNLTRREERICVLRLLKHFKSDLIISHMVEHMVSNTVPMVTSHVTQATSVFC